MNAVRRTSDQFVTRGKFAFTLVEILVVITIIGLLITMIGSFVGMSVRKAREAATTALIQKIDGLLDERMKGFERATKSPAFQQIVNTQVTNWANAGIVGVPPPVVAAVARKYFYQQNFPQYFAELADSDGNGLPNILQSDLTYAQAWNSSKHKPTTESAALLHFAVTKMQIFGVPPVGDTAFQTNEYSDTDGDGLPEFIDSWGRPLRFYRWPTRLLKPGGNTGPDGAYGATGVNDDLFGPTDDFLEFGTIGTDDVTVPRAVRDIAALLMSGLPTGPIIASQWDKLSEDPDDPYGLISTQWKFQYARGVGNLTLPSTVIPTMTTPLGASAYAEPMYPTLDTYHTLLVVSMGHDGDLGLYEPYEGTDTTGDGIPDSNLGMLCQPIHGTGGPYDFGTSALTPLGNQVISALSDNLTNRNRRAGKGR